MRKMNVTDGLTVRFPGRGADFDEGFEVGVLATLMSLKQVEFTRTVDRASLAQMAAIAEKLGYYVTETEDDGATVTVTYRSRRSRPKLRIVS